MFERLFLHFDFVCAPQSSNECVLNTKEVNRQNWICIKTSLTLSLFIELYVPSPECEWSCIMRLGYRLCYLCLLFFYLSLVLFRRCGLFVFHFKYVG